MYQFKPYSPKYFVELSNLNKKLVDTWFLFEKNFKHRTSATWENLTPYQRFAHGGPWNDLQTLKIHIREFLQFGKIDLLISEDRDEIVGEIEYHRIENGIHIDWMMIDPDYQGQGLGTKIIGYLVNLSELENWKKIATEAEEEALRFYLQCDFEQTLEYMEFKKTAKNTQETLWEDFCGVPEGKKVGEAMYDHEYFSFLIKTAIQYSHIFDTIHPVRSMQGDSGYYLKRINPFQMHESSLCFISDQGSIEQSTENLFSLAVENCKESEIIYVNLRDTIFSEWLINRRIPGLELIL